MAAPQAAGVADGAIAYGTDGKPAWVLANQQWVPYEAGRAPQPDGPISTLRDEYHAGPNGKWQHFTVGDKLAAAFAPITDASHNAGHEQPADKYGASRPDMHKDGSSASATTQAATASQHPGRPEPLNNADQKVLKEWAAIIDKKSWLAKNPAEKEFAKTVLKAVATGDWSEVAAMHPAVPSFRKSLDTWNAYWRNADAKARSDAWYANEADKAIAAMAEAPPQPAAPNPVMETERRARAVEAELTAADGELATAKANVDKAEIVAGQTAEILYGSESSDDRALARDKHFDALIALRGARDHLEEVQHKVANLRQRADALGAQALGKRAEPAEPVADPLSGMIV